MQVPSDHYKQYFDEMSKAIDSVDMQEVFKAGEILKEAYQKGRTVYTMGNGGSAATASHAANELGKCCAPLPKKGFRIMCLGDNVAQLTAYANDEGYENCFWGQLEPVLDEGDVLIAISGSGNSRNVVRACENGKKRGATVIAMTGFTGGKLMPLGDAKIHTPHEHWGRLEDLHMMMVHYLGNYMREVAFQK